MQRRTDRRPYARAMLALAAAATLAWTAAGCGGGGSNGSAQPATLEVLSTPGGAAIWINGVDTGQRTPAQVLHPVPGGGAQVQVVARLAGYDDGLRTLTLQPGQSQTVEFTLQPSQPPSVPPHTITGKVTLSNGGTTSPAVNAAVQATETTTGEVFSATIDTDPARAGVYYIYAPPGVYKVSVSQAGYQPQERELKIMSGEDRQTGIDFTLSP